MTFIVTGQAGDAMSSPAGIGIRNADGTISFIVIADFGWIKNGIGEVLVRDFRIEKTVRALILNSHTPRGYHTLYGLRAQKAETEIHFMRYCFFLPKCYILYTYVWKARQWYFRRLDGSGEIPLTQAISDGIED